MFGIRKIFYVFLNKSLLLIIKAAFIWSKIQKNTDIVKYYYNFKMFFSVLIYFKI